MGVGVGVGVGVDTGAVDVVVWVATAVGVADTLDVGVRVAVMAGVAVDVGVGVGTLVWRVNPAKGITIRASTATSPMICHTSMAFLLVGFIVLASLDCCCQLCLWNASIVRARAR